MADELDIIQKVFQHRLQQSDIDGILAALSRGEREELIGKIGDLLQRISALVEVANKVSDTLSLDVLLPRLIEIISETLNADRSTLFLYDPETDELFSRVAQGDRMGEIRFPAQAGIAGEVFTTGKSVIIADAYADSRFNPEIDRKSGYRTRNILCVPVLNKQREPIGAAQVLNKSGGDFVDDDRALLTALTSQAANALENARLFETVERQRRDESQLLEITSAISSNLQLEALLSKVISVTTEMLEADRSTLFMYDSKTGELWSRVAEGLDVKEIRFPANSGIAGACFSKGEVINIPDAYADPRFNTEVDRKTGYRTRNLLCMPIINKDGRRLGAMQVLNKAGGPFGVNDEKRLHAFTAQAAIALENAQLFEDILNERNYNESILKSLSNGVITLDATGKVLKANVAILKILGWDLDEVVEKPVEELFQGEENAWVLESLQNVRESEQTDIAMDADVKLSDGTLVSINLTTVPLIDINDEAIGYMLIIEDITTEKRVRSTMSKYMNKELADRLIEEGEDALRGSAQVATVLFSDIRSFTTIAEELGAPETVSMLNEYFTEMIDVIHDQGGMLDKYIGDAIMALFGVPFPGEGDPDRAIAASIEMIRALRRLNNARRSAGKILIRIGVGVNTGELFAGNIGSPKRMDYTAIGDTVNLSSRLESATKYYRVPILFTEFTADALKQEIASRKIDLMRVKGKYQPVSIFEALDHHTEETFPNMDRALPLFADALARYRRREWKSAGDIFREVLTLKPDDGPSGIYIDRCGHYLQNPPGDDWDGVWTMEFK